MNNALLLSTSADADTDSDSDSDTPQRLFTDCDKELLGRRVWYKRKRIKFLLHYHYKW